MPEEKRQNDDAPETTDAADPTPPCTSTDQEIAKARRWFQRAKELVDVKNWDFAIKCYIDGLNFWPDAVAEGHNPLRNASAERHLTGGKKLGFGESVKFSMTGRDAKKAMLNAEWLLAHDPFNISYMEGMVKNAAKLRAEETILWIGTIYFNAIEKEKKINPKRCALLRKIYEEAGDRHANRGDAAKAVELYERATDSLRLQRVADPKDQSLDNTLRDLSTKLTILKGKYETAESFRESVRDADVQKERQDEERLVQSDETIKQLIARAQAEVDENPDNPTKVRRLVELLCSRDDPADEQKAINLLVEKHKTYGEYSFKAAAEDIRVRQLKRVIRQAKQKNDPDALQRAQADLLKFEIKLYNDRIQAYPTNNRLKYELAVRLFQARKYDEAIPQFQAARADAKVRTQADLLLGRCFYQKKFYAQAVGTLSKAAANYEIPDDRVAKELQYWLGRAHEADGDLENAKKAFGQILELDYNFRDVRDRLSALS